MYICLTYVDIEGKLYAPGERVENDENAPFHLRVGAIREATAADFPQFWPPKDPPQEAKRAPKTHEAEETEGQEAEEAEETEGQEAEEAEETEGQEAEEAEPPQIDVEDAIAKEEKSAAGAKGRKGGERK